MATTRKKLPDAIRDAIRSAGWTNLGLSKACGVSQPVLSRFVRGHRGINLDTADLLCETLGLELQPISKCKVKRVHKRS